MMANGKLRRRVRQFDERSWNKFGILLLSFCYFPNGARLGSGWPGVLPKDISVRRTRTSDVACFVQNCWCEMCSKRWPQDICTLHVHRMCDVCPFRSLRRHLIQASATFEKHGSPNHHSRVSTLRGFSFMHPNAHTEINLRFGECANSQRQSALPPVRPGAPGW